MIRLLLSAFFLVAGVSSPAAISGTWTLNGDVEGVTYTATCIFAQKDNVVTGNCGDGKVTHELKGKIVGDIITFTHDSTYNDDAITMNYTGKIGTDGKFTGSVEVEPYGSDGTFTATKTAAAAQ